jgi:hypothetical protein
LRLTDYPCNLGDHGSGIALPILPDGSALQDRQAPDVDEEPVSDSLLSKFVNTSNGRGARRITTISQHVQVLGGSGTRPDADDDVGGELDTQHVATGEGENCEEVVEVPDELQQQGDEFEGVEDCIVAQGEARTGATMTVEVAMSFDNSRSLSG